MLFSPTVKKAIKAYEHWLKNKTKDIDPNATLSAQEQITLRHELSIGGTAVSSIMGVNPYTSALDLYNTMQGITPPKKSNYVMRRGLAMEKLIATRASELLNMDLYYPTNASKYSAHSNSSNVSYQAFPIESPTRKNKAESFSFDFGFSFVSAQFDCFVASPQNDEGLTIVECKTASRNLTNKDGSKLWGAPLELNDHGVLLNDDGSHNQIPPYYVDQVQWQLLLLSIMEENGCKYNFNTDYAFVALDMGGSDDVRLYKIMANEEHQINLLQSAASFMLNNVIANEPPLDFSTITPPSEGSEIEVFQADSTFEEACIDYLELKKTIKELSAKADELKKSLEVSLNDIEIGSIVDSQGKLLARKTKIVQSRFDSRALSNDHPDLYNTYKKDVECVRVDYY